MQDAHDSQNTLPKPIFKVAKHEYGKPFLAALYKQIPLLSSFALRHRVFQLNADAEESFWFDKTQGIGQYGKFLSTVTRQPDMLRRRDTF